MNFELPYILPFFSHFSAGPVVITVCGSYAGTVAATGYCKGTYLVVVVVY